MAKKAQRTSTANENVSAAYDRLSAAGNQVIADTKVMYQRITELETDLEDVHRDAQEKMLEITKEYDSYKRKTKQEIANLQAQVDNYATHFGSIVKAIQTPVTRKVQYTPDAED
jgi:molecular chaperone GrpE (heat shock protein)